ncbi:MAG: hypothetical protein NWE89_00655, partial [Candidatus Bathyarchaeota archaeon]|nr:hypothetical protein [Candidatus Bathyarchaeota archaeon]
EVRAEHVSSRVIFKLGDQFVHLNSIGILWIDGDKPPTMIRGLTKKELTKVVRGLVERLDTIDDGLNSMLVTLDTMDKARKSAEEKAP